VDCDLALVLASNKALAAGVIDAVLSNADVLVDRVDLELPTEETDASSLSAEFALDPDL
jgi:hypothetical protein